jgi:hypothetical protein
MDVCGREGHTDISLLAGRNIFCNAKLYRIPSRLDFILVYELIASKSHQPLLKELSYNTNCLFRSDRSAGDHTMLVRDAYAYSASFQRCFVAKIEVT